VGDNLRKYPRRWKAESRAFLGVNRSKRGVVLDLRTRATTSGCWPSFARRRAGAQLPARRAERLGIAWEQLRKVNPRLVYCASPATATPARSRNKAGYDQVLQT